MRAARRAAARADHHADRSGSLELDLQAMVFGVADYLDKSRLDAVPARAHDPLCPERGSARREQLSRLAQHDELTGLANRSLLEDRLERALAWARRRERLVAVMVLDLNGFKAVNDRLGHVAGDRLLTIMGTRLCSRLRETDTVARLGGDEFAICWSRTSPSPSTPPWWPASCSTRSSRRLTVDRERSPSPRASASRSTRGRQHGPVGAEADRAMYRAKAEGGNLCRFSSDQIERRVQRGALLEADLRHGLEQYAKAETVPSGYLLASSLSASCSCSDATTSRALYRHGRPPKWP